ncbi:MAG: MFS transporter [Candidatus Electryonea clarkiae]|nr:MFS transporter [Candidatus Electryonea clarkiae]MDP8286708.1 MFS transporter [Candidatus Electryonea clarkiae]
MNRIPEEPGQQNFIARIGNDYWQGLKDLTTCPREIWIAYLIKIFESLCYFSSVLILMPFLTQDMGLTDIQAGTFFGIFSASMSFFMLFVGFIADSLGIKRALLIGLFIALIGRIAITFTTNPWVVYPGLFVLSIGFAYMIPLIAAAVKLFSTRKAQKYAYSWYYVVMNVGSMIAGLSLDGLRSKFTDTITFDLLGNELSIRPLQVIFFVSILATLISLVLTFFFIRSKIPAEAFKSDYEETTKPEIKNNKYDAVTYGEEKKSAWCIMIEVGREKIFWVFILFILLLVLVKMIFQYNHSLYPLYMERIGLKNWTGKLYSINPIMIIFLVPVMTAITGKMKAYNVILVGSFISAASVLVLGLGESIMYIVMFQVILSLGEALWSPRLYDYTASIAPEGKEASYMALSKVPMFFAKVGAGPATGILLAMLCPAEGPRNTELMWIIVGISTLISPLTLFLGRKWLDVESRKKMENL